MLKKKFIWIIMLILSSLAIKVTGQVNSVLSDGNWIKITIKEDNVYKLTYSDLQSYGFNPSVIDPETIKIYGNGGGMLPQSNNIDRPIDLMEVPILVFGTEDNSFDSEDYIIFWGEGPDKIDYDSVKSSFNYQNHIYTDNNYYYLTYGSTQGQRIGLATSAQPGTIQTSGYNIYTYERDLNNILNSGRIWFGESFDLETIQTFDTRINNILPGSDVRIKSSVMSRSPQVSTFHLKVNNYEAGTHHLDANPVGTYQRKGIVDTRVFDINQTDIGSDSVTVTYEFDKESGVGYLDYFQFDYLIPLEYESKPLIFYSGDIAKDNNVTYNISNCPAGLMVWDITDHNTVKEIDYSQSGSTITFNASSKSRKLLVFDPSSIDNKPDVLQTINNQNLHGNLHVDLLIISPEQLISFANEIGSLRTEEGLSVAVVTPGEIYNEFSSGKVDITAIRDYAKYLYQNAGLRYLLLFGKGTYDTKNILETNLSLIPIYESRNSLLPLGTYGSDDYLGFFEENEGEWEESSEGDHTLEIGIGRIPVINETEARTYVEKLKRYQSSKSIGDWRTNLLFIAENGDLNIHQRDAERLATLVDTTYTTFNTDKIYLDAYKIESLPGKKVAPEANNDLYNSINNGALITNFTGHGNENQWAFTNIFDKYVIDSLENPNYLSLFVTATCEFGRHDDTKTRSGGEELVVKHPTGAIGMITTARPVFSSSNYQLNRAFYQNVFEKVNGEYQRIGDVFLKTKNNSLSGVLNRNFSLLADPSMKLAYPSRFITLDSLEKSPIQNSDTLSALKHLEFIGSIKKSNQEIDMDFNGEVQIKIYDKPRVKSTLGNLGDSPFNYTVRDNCLFDGKATVINGKFSFNTVLPKDISYNPGRVKISLYAQRGDNLLDASGANINLLLGKTAAEPIVDQVPPEIDLFMGDTSYVNGQPVNANTLLIAKLYDENGINTSKTQVGHEISYSLDGGDPVVLNDYYTTLLDDYTTGWIYYNLPKLSTGNHTIEFTAWDTSNNPSTSIIEFYVAQEGQVILTELSNYPNPLRDHTTFTLAHNLAGEEIVVTLKIMSTSGQIMFEETKSFVSAPSVIDNWFWDGRNSSGGKLNEGLYLYGINIRSNNSNLSQSVYSRLFITN